MRDALLILAFGTAVGAVVARAIDIEQAETTRRRAFDARVARALEMADNEPNVLEVMRRAMTDEELLAAKRAGDDCGRVPMHAASLLAELEG